MRFVLFILLVFGLVACGGKSRQRTAEVPVSVSKTYPRYADADPVDWTGITPWSYPIHGIDVSKYQGQIDWSRAKRNGVSFAFIKATEGGDHKDELFRDHWRGAARAGVKRGAYHFFYFCRPAAEQARWFIQNVPKTAGTLPPVLDMEWNHTSRTCQRRPPAHQVRQEIRTYTSILARHYGKSPLIYTTIDFYKQNQLSLIKNREFWLRSVAGHPSDVYGRQLWAFWQYTGSGLVPGVQGRTDINVFRGTPLGWTNWLKANAQ